MSEFNFKFKTIDNLYPDKLETSVNKLSETLSEYSDKGFNNNWVIKILKKIKNKNKLTKREQYVLLKRIDQFPSSEAIVVRNAITNEIEKETFTKVAADSIKTWVTYEGLQFMIKSNQNFNLFEGIKNNLNLSSEYSGGGLNAVTKSLLNSEEFIETGRQLIFQYSGFIGLKNYLNQGIDADLGCKYLSKSMYSLLLLLDESRLSDDVRLQILDRYAKNHMNNFSDWETSLFNNNEGVGAIAKWLIERNDFLNIYNYLNQIMSSYRDLNDKFDLLSKKVLERGVFWKNHLNLFSVVIPRSLSGNRVAIAMYVGSYVIIEFGPENNAAYVYSRDTFDGAIKHSNNWSDKRHSVKEFPNWLNAGRIIHKQGWQQHTRRFIEMLKDI